VNEEKKDVPEAKGAQQGASTKAIVALVLGILGLAFCPPTAIVAWILGKQELNAIARGESSPQGRGMAKAGFILGIIGTVLIVLWIIFGAGIMGHFAVRSAVTPGAISY